METTSNKSSPVNWVSSIVNDVIAGSSEYSNIRFGIALAGSDGFIAFSFINV